MPGHGNPPQVSRFNGVSSGEQYCTVFWFHAGAAPVMQKYMLPLIW
jgi:hypothetical protein